jgi:hypothetical protein
MDDTEKGMQMKYDTEMAHLLESRIQENDKSRRALAGRMPEDYWKRE